MIDVQGHRYDKDVYIGIDTQDIRKLEFYAGSFVMQLSQVKAEELAAKINSALQDRDVKDE